VKIDEPALLNVMGAAVQGIHGPDPSHNPHSTEICPRFPPCQIYRRWMASIQQPQTSDKADIRQATSNVRFCTAARQNDIK